MFAIVDISGSQEKVTVGDTLKVPLQVDEAGNNVFFDKVMMISDGDNVTFGAPLIDGAKVEAKVLAHGRYDKIRVVKMMKRKRYRRVKGHKQHYTNIEITGIKL
ncbi:MAG: ribosomal protein [Candidatus Peribacteria bacterium]|nr:ribosomal protein [Candidatus Peribacteria bacterium]